MLAIDLHRLIPEGVSQAEFARVAGVNPIHLSQVLGGRHRPRPALVAKLRFAASRIRNRQIDGDQRLAVIYRTALALSALATGAAPDRVQAAQASVSNNLDPAWRHAAQARRVAQYLMNTTLGLTQAEVARVCGVTRQAVSIAVGEIEQMRDDRAFDAMLERLEQWIGVGP